MLTGAVMTPAVVELVNLPARASAVLNCRIALKKRPYTCSFFVCRRVEIGAAAQKPFTLQDLRR